VRYRHTDIGSHSVHLHQFHATHGAANQVHGFGLDQRRRHRRPHKQRKPHQHEAGEAVGVAQRLQAEHGANYGTEGSSSLSTPDKSTGLIRRMHGRF
jgi:hypothetical protein